MLLQRFIVFLLIILFSSSSAFADVTGTASVIDADTLEIHGTRIRLIGIDAPENGQLCYHPDSSSWRCGQKAALALSDYINRRPVECVGDKNDRYKRLLAVCYVDHKDLNAWLVEEGWAVAYRRYSTVYVDQEEQAEANKKGIWSGDFEMPWEWRKKKRNAK
jgi:endonuclease YncB( thermonuclease family)